MNQPNSQLQQNQLVYREKVTAIKADKRPTVRPTSRKLPHPTNGLEIGGPAEE